MPTYALYRVYQITEMRDDAVYKTRHVDSIWLPLVERTPEEEAAIAKGWKGDILGSPDPKTGYCFDAKNRRPKFTPQIVANLRQSRPELAPFTDDQIYNAYDDYYFTEDAGDESKVIDYVQE